jgi:hypothetical protein
MVGATAGLRSLSCALLDYVFIAVLTCALSEIGESTVWRQEPQRPDSALKFWCHMAQTQRQLNEVGAISMAKSRQPDW